MNRRKFIAAVAAAPLVGDLAFLSPSARAAESLPALGPEGAGWRSFEVITRVTLPDDPGSAQLWLPLAQTAGGYQCALDLHWKGTGQTGRVNDACYGAPLLRTTWEASDRSPRQLELVQTVATRDRTALGFLPLTEAERQFWPRPTASVPLDGIIRETVGRITAGKNTPRERLRALYDWVVDNTHRNPDTPGCGRGDVKTMLQLGQLGGKCADINGLMVGLARAAGFPARDVYGIRVADSRLFPSLGRHGDISKAQHCRAEVFLDGEGWFPIDPADVRKVVLEQKLALESPEVRALRDRLFGSWEMNWVGYNSATDIALPDAGSPKPDFAFLMYPCAFTSAGACPCLDPAHFRYEISSREVPG